jgi:hypothetical protein
MLIESLLALALCIGVPLLVGACINYGGQDDR